MTDNNPFGPATDLEPIGFRQGLVFGFLSVPIIILILLLAACGSSNNPPPPSPPPPPATSWHITQSSQPPPVVSADGFDFPLAANANTKWVSYFELPFTTDISRLTSISVTYTLTGDNPVFDHSTPNNVSTGPAAIYVMLHRAGDNMTGQGDYAYYRWFGPILKSPPVYPLELGTHTITLPLNDLLSWASLADQQQEWFDLTRSNMGSIGVTFGGGDFYSHGICVTSGAAHFHLDGYSIQ